MAAAALGNAARRRLEGCLLQRTPARRLVHSGGCFVARPKLQHPSAKPAAETQNDSGKINSYKQISDKKEELFDLLADTERRYGTDFTKERRQNIRLLQQLAVQVQPRPDDSLWRSKRRSKRINDFVGFTGAFVAGYTLTKNWILYKKEVLGKTPEGAKQMDLADDKQ